MALVVDRADLGYPGRVVLTKISLSVPAGEIVILIGPNGAGKTTLLRAMAGQLKPIAGTIRLDGAVVCDQSPGWIASRIAIARTTDRGDRPLSVAEAVSLGRAPHRGWLLPLRASDRAIVEHSLARTGLAGFENRPVTELSDGESQRVGLARALAQSPQALLVDEPTSHLDLRYQSEVLDHLRQLASEGLAIVAALHDLNLAAAWADRVALVADGRLVAVGSPNEVLTADRLSDAYRTPLAVTRRADLDVPLVLPIPKGRR